MSITLPNFPNPEYNYPEGIHTYTYIYIYIYLLLKQGNTLPMPSDIFKIGIIFQDVTLQNDFELVNLFTIHSIIHGTIYKYSRNLT